MLRVSRPGLKALLFVYVSTLLLGIFAQATPVAARPQDTGFLSVITGTSKRTDITITATRRAGTTCNNQDAPRDYRLHRNTTDPRGNVWDTDAICDAYSGNPLNDSTGCNPPRQFTISIKDSSGAEIANGQLDCLYPNADARNTVTIQIPNAAATGTLSGTITVNDPNNKPPDSRHPAPGTTVTLTNEANANLHYTYTLPNDEGNINIGSGKYRITGITPGTYSVKVQGEYNSVGAASNEPFTFTKTGVQIKTGNNTLDINADGTLDGNLANAAASDDICDNVKDFTELNFWVCGFIKLVRGIIVNLDKEVNKYLRINTKTIFSGDTGKAYFQAFSVFRNFAYVVGLLFAIFMVLSQVLGLDLVSPLTLRKKGFEFVLLMIAASLVWPGFELFYNAMNALGAAASSILSAPFSHVGPPADAGIGSTVSLGVLVGAILTVGVPAGVAALGFLGVGGIAALLGGGLLTVATAWILLSLRDVAAPLMPMLYVIALMTRLFTNKFFGIVNGFALTLGISVPLVAFAYAGIDDGAKVAVSQGLWILAIILLLIKYFSTLKILQSSDKLSGQAGNVVGSGLAGARKGLRKYRGDTMRRRAGEAVSGQRNIRGTGAVTGLMRRGKMADQGGLNVLSRNSRARYRGAEKTMLANTVAEMMKRDGGRAGGDDDAMKLAMQKDMTDSRFLREYRNNLLRSNPSMSRSEASRRSSTALGAVRSSFGAQLGTDAMRVAAYKSLLDSKTSYKDERGAQDTWEQIIGDGNSLMADGLMNSTDVTMAIKSRADRSDRSGVGFGTLQSQVDNSFQRYRAGARHGATGRGGQELVTKDEAKAMRKEAVFGTQSGGLVAGRHEAVTALSGTMRESVEESYVNQQAASRRAEMAGVNDRTRDRILASARAVPPGGTLNFRQQAAVEEAQATEQFQRELAAVAGRYDAMGQVSQQNATIMANNVMSYVLPGDEGKTIQQLVEDNRNEAGFKEMRREYQTQAGYVAGGTPTPGTTPGAPPPPPAAVAA